MADTLSDYYGLGLPQQTQDQIPASNALSGNPISFPSLDAPLGGTTRSRGQKLMGAGGGADLSTKLGALGAMFTNKVPEFRQQMMQEREAESMLGVQELQKREMLDKSLAKDYFTAHAMAENGDYQGFMDLMEDRLRNERKLGLDTSSTLEIMQDAQGPDGLASVMPYLKSTVDASFAAGYLTPAEVSKPLDSYRPLTTTDMDYLEQQGIFLDRSKGYQVKNNGEISTIGGSGPVVDINNIGNVPAGYRLLTNPDGSVQMEVVEGGPVDREIRRQEEEDEAAETEEQNRQAVAAEGDAFTSDLIITDLGRIRRMVENQGLFTPVTGWRGNFASSIAGTPAFDVKELITGIGANIQFQALSDMREASKTGGALGSITENELRDLRATVGSLVQAQSKEQLLENMDRVERLYRNIMRKAMAYPEAEEYGLKYINVADPLGLFR